MLTCMSRVSPTAEGFRAAFRRPLFAFGEITWRWAVGATATVLFFFGLLEFLNTLPVTNGEILFLRTRQPFLVSQAIAHILRGTLNRGVMSLMLAAILMAVVWIIAASLGRIATVGAIVDYVRGQITGKAAAFGIDRIEEQPVPEANPFHALIRLNFLRVALVLASLCAFWGASILASFVSSAANPRPGLAFLIFLPVAVLVGLAWFALNWLLSLASVFAVREGADAAAAIASAVGLCRERTGAVFAVSTWTGLAHLVAFVAATTAVSMPLGLAGLLPWRLVVLVVIVLTLAYFAVADWIYTARVAGYVAILEIPEAWWAPPLPPPPPPPVPAVGTSIDKDELILSDVPQPAL